MPTFFYKATDQNGNITEGETVGVDKEEVASFLIQKNLTPFSIKLKEKEKKLSFKNPLSIVLFSKINISDKIQFVSRLSALLKAGIGISEAFNIMLDGEEKPIVKKFLFQVKVNLEKGQALHSSLEDYKKYFSPVFIGLIKVGEQSGNLDKILDEIAVDLKKEYEIKKKIRAASFYPALLAAATVIIIGVLMVFVMPKMLSTFEASSLKLPLITRILISVSAFLKNNLILIFIAVVGIIVLVPILKRSAVGDLLFTKIIDRLPLAGDLSRKTALAAFCRNFSMISSSGISVIETLEMTAEAVGNRIYKAKILEARDSIQKGLHISETLKNYPKHFPSLLTGTMKAGEQSGKLSEMLKSMGNFYEEEIDSSLSSLISTIEPVLLIFMGFAIGGIAMAILLPIYQLVSSF